MRAVLISVAGWVIFAVVLVAAFVGVKAKCFHQFFKLAFILKQFWIILFFLFWELFWVVSPLSDVEKDSTIFFVLLGHAVEDKFLLLLLLNERLVSSRICFLVLLTHLISLTFWLGLRVAEIWAIFVLDRVLAEVFDRSALALIRLQLLQEVSNALILNHVLQIELRRKALDRLVHLLVNFSLIPHPRVFCVQFI